MNPRLNIWKLYKEERKKDKKEFAYYELFIENSVNYFKKYNSQILKGR